MRKAIQYRQRNGRLILCVVGLFICSLVIFSCANSQPPKRSNGPPKNEKYHYGFGTSKKNMQEAGVNARADLAMNIKSDIESESKLIQHYKEGTEGYEEFQNQTFVSIRRSIENIEPYKTQTPSNKDPHYHYYVRISHEDFCKQLEDEYSKIKKMVTSGDKKQETGDVVSALELYREAKSLSISIKSTCGIKEKISLNDIQQKINDILNHVDIKRISGNKQVGEYGNALAESLIVKVQYKDSSPLDDFPLQATYTQGTGQLENRAEGRGDTVRTHTDEMGKAVFWVKAIKSISQNNSIQVAVNTASIQLPPKAIDAIDFHYASSFPNSDMNGSPIVYLNGYTKKQEQEFAVGDSVYFEIQIAEKSYVSLFKIFPDGYLEFMDTIRISDTYEGSGFDCYDIISKKPGWTLRLRCNRKVTEERGFGLETLLVVKTGQKNLKKKESEKRSWTAERLINELDKAVGRDIWRVGWMSYLVRKD